MATGGLRAGCAALQGLPGGCGDLQYHAGHAVVSVAGGLILIPLLRLTSGFKNKILIRPNVLALLLVRTNTPMCFQFDLQWGSEAEKFYVADTEL